MDILFSNPTYLWFLLATPLLVLHHFSSLKKVKGQVLQFANFKAIARITGMQPQQTNLYVLIGRVMILTFIVFAVAGTIIWYSGTSGDSDYVLAIDASSSMLANDITPTRLEAAKETGLLFIELVPPKSKVGLLTFSGTAFV
ncbi:MAG TPA: BatA domain-containing protein, partial [Candidatus Nanoarchaeia archaeon]|nr:BatA domain-containing protein [Candidatus Nanoarchaeia archaeon]